MEARPLEICGDGRNLGQRECDDGNLEDGDGCSSQCRVELGFECTSAPDLPDICVDVKAPTAAMQLRSGNLLVILFSEQVLSTVDSEELVKTMEVWLKKKCELDWTLVSTFTAYTIFETLQLKVAPKCSFDRSGNTYVVHFKDTHLIQDKGSNALSTSTLEAKALKYQYAESEEAVRTIGTVMKYTTVGTFGLMLFLSVFQGCAVGSFWHFVNMLQVLSYLPVLDCVLPDNYRMIVTNYLSEELVTIPFDLIPEFPYNPLNYLAVFLTEPFNENFKEMDFESVSFVFNFSDELLTWLSLGLVYFALHVFALLAPQWGYARD